MAEWSGSRERKKSARVERVSGANLPGQCKSCKSCNSRWHDSSACAAAPDSSPMPHPGPQSESLAQGEQGCRWWIDGGLGVRQWALTGCAAETDVPLRLHLACALAKVHYSLYLVGRH
ncbi:hypothetical protein L1887_63125 [Cichorium endivia]|nr:hypothetical protein L1887_63125 [Cichorium endivia]